MMGMASSSRLEFQHEEFRLESKSVSSQEKKSLPGKAVNLPSLERDRHLSGTEQLILHWGRLIISVKP